MAEYEHRRLDEPDETRSFDRGRAEVIKIGGGTVGRYTLEPGWRWRDSVKPIAGTEWCEAAHFQYHVSGRLHVMDKDGSEYEIGPGEVSMLPPGHDAWVVGDEPVIVIDWSGATSYAR